MSSHTPLPNINSELISLFAVLDSWCDKADDFLNKTSEEKSPLQSLIFILSLNEAVLKSSKLDLDLSAINVAKGIDHEECAHIEAYPIREIAQNIERHSRGQLRRLLRDQLYRFLCVVDSLDRIVFEFPAEGVKSRYMKGCDGVRLVLDNMVNEISLHEEVPMH